jgi:hypothetical protein
MEAKEKAKELFNKYKPICAGYNGGQSNKYFSKQAALIAVDEVLGQFKWRPKDSLSYWEEVKKEIENL